MHSLALALPIALVAHNILQIFVTLYVVAAHNLRGVGDDLLGQADLARNLHGKRTAGITYLQLEQRTHLATVIEHCSIDNAGCRIGKMFQVLVVRGDYTVRPAFVETLEQCLGNGCTDEGFCSATELIDEDKRPVVAVAQCMLHVEQVARICTQVVLNALLVADINEETVEKTGTAAFMYGNEHTALQHVLQETGSLQTHRLSTGIRTGYEQYTAFAVKFNVKRRHLASMLAQREFEQRMICRSPVYHGTVCQRWFQGIHAYCNFGLCTYEIHLAKEVIGLQQRRHLRTQFCRECREYDDYLALLLGLEFAYAVVCLYDLGRLNEHGLSTCRLIVHNTAHLAFESRSNRNHQTAVAHCGRGVFLYKSLGLRTAKNGVQGTRYAARCTRQLATYTGKGRRSTVLH